MSQARDASGRFVGSGTRVNFNAGLLNALGEKGAMDRLVRAGFRMANDVKLSMGDSGPAGPGGATRAERHANRSKPGEPPHVDTGRLRASISVNWSGSGMDNGKTDAMAKDNDGVTQPTGAFRVRVGTNVEYGAALEYGTRNMEPRPYLRPARDRLKI